jgi:hypothetical protein
MRCLAASWVRTSSENAVLQILLPHTSMHVGLLERIVWMRSHATQWFLGVRGLPHPEGHDDARMGVLFQTQENDWNVGGCGPAGVASQ